MTNSHVTTDAIHVGLTEFKWVHENGFKLNPEIWKAVIKVGNIEILRYCWEKGILKIDEEFVTRIMVIKKTGNLEFLKEIGFKFPDEIWNIANSRRNCLALKWAKKNNYKISEACEIQLHKNDGETFYG